MFITLSTVLQRLFDPCPGACRDLPSTTKFSLQDHFAAFSRNPSLDEHAHAVASASASGTGVLQKMECTDAK